jgi:hypothetical protein
MAIDRLRARATDTNAAMIWSLRHLRPEFAEAFSCAPETPMNPKDRCEVW